MVPFTGAFTVWGPVCLYLYFVNGDAFTASELALEAGVTKQSAISHLSKLVDGGLGGIVVHL